MMAKKRQQPARIADLHADSAQGATLKERLGADIIGKLKAQADEMKQAEAERLASLRKREEEAKKKERERLENDFSYLLENSDSNWNKYK